MRKEALPCPHVTFSGNSLILLFMRSSRFIKVKKNKGDLMNNYKQIKVDAIHSIEFILNKSAKCPWFSSFAVLLVCLCTYHTGILGNES